MAAGSPLNTHTAWLLVTAWTSTTSGPVPDCWSKSRVPFTTTSGIGTPLRIPRTAVRGLASHLYLQERHQLTQLQILRAAVPQAREERPERQLTAVELLQPLAEHDQFDRRHPQVGEHPRAG